MSSHSLVAQQRRTASRLVLKTITTLAMAGSLVSMSVLAADQASAAPPSLSGEFLSAGSSSGNGGTLVTSATCSATSASTIAFTATGTAIGPYPGTFTETGVITVSTDAAGQFVDGVPFYRVSALDAFFTIDSTVGTVTGSKHLVTSGVIGLCDNYSNELFGNTESTVTGFFREISPDNGWGESYDALIVSSDGTYRDTGRSGILLDDLNFSSISPAGSVTPSNVINSGFDSSGITPVGTVGDSTGGGQIVTGGRVAFGFVARSSGTGFQGQCDVVDQTAGVLVHCVDVTSWLQLSPTTVRFAGHALVNGQSTSYQVDTQDVADPGVGSDTFSIATGTGYSASGTLARGNVQIHRS
jgi:hypothetical protein